MRLKSELIRTVVRDKGPKDAERFVSILMALDDEVEVANDPQFESQHPRGNGGQFAPKGSGETGGSSAPQTSFKAKTSGGTGSKQSASKSTAFHIAKGIESALNAFETGKAKPTASLLNKMERHIDSMIKQATSKVSQAMANASKAKKWNKEHGFNATAGMNPNTKYRANNTIAETKTESGGSKHYNQSGKETYELNPDGTVKSIKKYDQYGNLIQ